MYKYYKDTNDQVFAFAADGSQDEFIPNNLVEINQAQADALRAQPQEQSNQPLTVSSWKIRKALNQLNLRDVIEAAVSSSADQNLKDGWEYATEFVESEPLVLQMAQALGKSQQELHDIFTLASTL